LVDKGVRMVL